MATELAKAYVQIVPSAKGIKGSITKELGGEAKSAGDSAGASLGSSLVGKLKGIVAAAGIGAVVKDAISAGADLEQSFGGLDTLYGDASAAAKQYASEAAAAGISMNDYAEQAVSFGASLKQAFGGDTARAAEAANTAILDMADNAAKMGTPLENIQNAYQGFAKQNYTMLDNLKLGYGGTKTEMERLLKDAQKLSGVEYNIDNLGDVYDAIHVIQDDLGLTGVAAEEASQTLSGSLGAMKASFQNLLATITTGGDIGASIQTLGNSVFNFVQNNLLPMLGRIFESMPAIVSGLFSNIIRALNASANSDFGGILSSFTNVIQQIGIEIISDTPYIIESFLNLLSNVGNALVTFDWGGFASGIISDLKDSLDLVAGEIFGQDEFIIGDIVNTLINGASQFMDVAYQFLSNLIAGILTNLPSVIESAGQVVNSFLSALLPRLPELLEKGHEMLSNLVQGILTHLPDVASSMLKVIGQLLATIASNLPQILTAGINIITKLQVGLIQAIPRAVAAIPKVISAIKDAFGKFDWKEIGLNILKGIAEGITNSVNFVIDAAKQAAKDTLNAAKSALGIHSPSRAFEEEVGKQIPAGMARGIVKNTRIVTDAINDTTSSMLRSPVNFGNIGSATLSTNAVGQEDEVLRLLANYLPIIANKDNSIVLSGDADRMFSVMQSKASRYKQVTGNSAFA